MSQNEVPVTYNELQTLSGIDITQSIQAQLNSKEGASLTNGHIFVGNASNVPTDVALSGDATLANTGAITVLNSAVIGKVLTGYVSGAGTVAATDTILQGFNKLNGNAAAISTVANAALPSASFTDAAVTGKLITGYVSGAGTVSATDTILQAINKLNGNVSAVSISSWASFTPTGSWVSNTTYTGFSRQVGDTLDVQVHIALAGAPTSATLTVNLPAGKTIDTTKIASAANPFTPLGSAIIRQNGVAIFNAGVVYNTTTSIEIVVYNATSTYLTVADCTQAVPFTFGDGDFLNFTYSVPVV